MPAHDWSRVTTNLFQHFHNQWISELVDCLNSGVLPDGFYATGQQTAGIYVPDLLANRYETPGNGSGASESQNRGAVLLSDPPKATYIESLDEIDFARRQRSILIQHAQGREVAAIVEIVSESNKASQRKLQQFVRKATDAILQGCHLLIVDLFRPTSRDPDGIHREIWQELGGKPHAQPADKPLTLAAYDAVPFPVAYVEPIAPGDRLQEMPLFLQDELYVKIPLEETYMRVVSKLPPPLKAELA
jgi:hypothetical protein